MTKKITRRNLKNGLLAFSDCIVISVPLRSDLAEHEGTFDVLMSELTSFAWAQGACVLRGIFPARRQLPGIGGS